MLERIDHRPRRRRATRTARLRRAIAVHEVYDGLRGAVGRSLLLWSVTSERVDHVARMTVTAPDLDLTLEELARYAAVDAARA